MDNKSQPQEKRQELREQLASLCHEQWAGWMRYLFENCSLIPETFAIRWKRQMNTPYAELSKAEKDSDRKEADRILALLQQPTGARCEVSVTGKHRIDTPYCKDCGREFPATGPPSLTEDEAQQVIGAIPLQVLPVTGAREESGQKSITFTALIEVLERLRSKNRNPNREWYNGWNAAIDCLIHDAKAAIAPASAPAAPQDTAAHWAARDYNYAVRIARHLASTHFPDVQDWRPLSDMDGVLSQIDNMICAWKPSTTTTSEPAIEAARALSAAGYLDRDLFVKVSDKRFEKVAAIISKHIAPDAGEVERLQVENTHFREQFALLDDPDGLYSKTRTGIATAARTSAITEAVGKLKSLGYSKVWTEKAVASLDSLLDKPDAAQKEIGNDL